MKKNYFYLKKNIAGIISVLLLTISGCGTEATQLSPIQTPVPTSISQLTSRIYFVAYTELTSQVWQIEPNGGKATVLYEIVRDTDTPAHQVIPKSEVEYLDDTLSAVSSTLGKTPEILPRPKIINLTLSPTRKHLALNELDWYCVQQTSSGCAGVTRVIVFDLERSEKKVLWELPLDGDSNFISDGPVWSPNGRYIALIRDTWKIKSVPMIFDVTTEQVREFTNANNPTYPIWPFDSSKIAWLQYDNNISLQLCTLDTQACENHELKDISTTKFVNIDWGPYGKEIVYTSGGGYTLNLFNPMTGSTRKIATNVKGTTENPRWSPDGQNLVVDNRSGTGPDMPIQSLLVIDSKSGQVVNHLQLKQPGLASVWGSDGNTLLVLTNDYELDFFDIHQSTSKSVTLPDNLRGKKIGFINW